MDVEELVREAVPDADGPGCAVGLVRAGQPLVTAYRGLVTHLDWFPFPEITVDQLIRHTSGLRDQWELFEAAGRRMEDVLTTEDVVRLVGAQRGLNFPPGTAQRYSNTGYTLLGLIVAATNGLSLREFCARRIFEPLGMSSTRFVDDCHELARWVSYEPAMRALRERPVRDYGLGVWVDAGLGTMRHSGADAGYRSHLVVLPDQGLAAIALANDASLDPELLCDMLIGAPVPRPGLFYSDELDAHVRLVHERGQLSLVWPTREAPLRRQHDGSYVAYLSDTAECPQATVQFAFGQFRYSTPGAEGILFQRREVACSNSEPSP